MNPRRCGAHEDLHLLIAHLHLSISVRGGDRAGCSVIDGVSLMIDNLVFECRDDVYFCELITIQLLCTIVL